MTFSKKLVKRHTRESFIETYGAPTLSKEKISGEKKRAMFQKLAKDASKLMRSVSLKKIPERGSMRRCSTISAPDDFLRTSSERSSQLVNEEKSKLLKEILAQREELLREQKILENLVSFKHPNKLSLSYLKIQFL